MWNDHGKVLFPPIGRAKLSIAEKLGKFQGLDSAFSAAMRLHAARRLIAVKRCRTAFRLTIPKCECSSFYAALCNEQCQCPLEI
jgi:hypothetical protein